MACQTGPCCTQFERQSVVRWAHGERHVELGRLARELQPRQRNAAGGVRGTRQKGQGVFGAIGSQKGDPGGVFKPTFGKGLLNRVEMFTQLGKGER